MSATIRADSRRKGGLVTLQRYGREQLRDWGKLGGRPRLPTHDEIRQQRLLEQDNNNDKEVIQGSPSSLTQLRRQYKLRQRSNGNLEIPEAGIAQNTPTGQSLPEREAVR